jgi:hypothetical protein
MVGKVKTAARRGAAPEDTDDEGHDTGVDRRTPRAHKPVLKYSPSHQQQVAAAVKKRPRVEVADDRGSSSGSESEEGKDSQRSSRMKRARKPAPPQPPPQPASSDTDRSENDDAPLKELGVSRAAASRPAPKPAAQHAPARGKGDMAASSRLPSASSQLHSQVQKGKEALAQLSEACQSALAAISLALDAGDALLGDGGADIKAELKTSGRPHFPLQLQ